MLGNSALPQWAEWVKFGAAIFTALAIPISIWIAVARMKTARAAAAQTVAVDLRQAARQRLDGLSATADVEIRNSVGILYQFSKEMHFISHQISSRKNDPNARLERLDQAFKALALYRDHIPEEALSTIRQQVELDNGFSSERAREFMDAIREPFIACWRDVVLKPLRSSFEASCISDSTTAELDELARKTYQKRLSTAADRAEQRVLETLPLLLRVGHQNLGQEQRSAYEKLIA